MSPRSFSASSVVTLPRLSAVSAARLLQELLVAAKAEKKLPASFAADRDELAVAYDALHAELAKRLVHEGEMSPRVAAADRVEDNAFGALHDWLRAIARLPADRHPEAALAAGVLQAIYPTGLGFLAIAPENEWQEAEVRLGVMAEKGHDETIEKLGGSPFLAELEIAHAAYGAALGITAVKAAPEAPAIRATYEAALEVIRAYVLRVTAHVRRSDPSTAELSARLLAPLTTWKDRAPRAAPQDDAPSPPANPSPPAG
jgi:hypothetical protein